MMLLRFPFNKMKKGGYLGCRTRLKNMFTPKSDDKHTVSTEKITFFDSTIKTEAEIDILICTPKNENVGDKNVRIFIHFHGGGFCVGHPNFYWRFLYHPICKKYPNYVVISPDYRKGPKYKMGSIKIDLEETLKWAVKRYGNKKIILSGDSAGGWAVAYLSHMLRDNKYEFNGINIKKQNIFCISLYPFLSNLNDLPKEIPINQQLYQNGMYLDEESVKKFTKAIDDGDDFYNMFNNVKNLSPQFIAIVEHDMLRTQGYYYVNLLKKEDKIHKLYEVKNDVHGMFLNLMSRGRDKRYESHYSVTKRGIIAAEEHWKQINRREKMF